MEKIKRNISITLFILYEELVLLILIGGNLENIILKIFFTIFNALTISLFMEIFDEKINKVIYYTIIVLIPLICSIYCIYYKLFHSVLSLYSCVKGNQIFQFKTSIMHIVEEYWYVILVFFIPTIVYCILINKKLNFEKIKKEDFIKKIICIIGIYIISIGFINIKSEEKIYSLKNLYYNINYPSENFKYFGLLTTIRIDIQRTIFPFKEKELYEYTDEKGNIEILDKQEYNIENIDFEELIRKEDNETIKEIHQYIKSREPTQKNEYTGKYKGKNLIVIVAESFSLQAIKEDVTPTLYKMANQGFQFKNFYTPLFPVSTADGEYLTDTSLLPAEGTWSIEKIAGNTVPYSYANVLKQLNYKTYAYHNYRYDYYQRDKYFYTMGYEQYLADGNGLEKRMNFDNVPASDLEMMQVTIEDYINEDRFLAYYMTMSGHMEYDKSNAIVNKNWDKVKNLNYSDKAKAYLATQIELDKAIEFLINTLEENGRLKDTVIMIVGDHYPYGLSEKEIRELSGNMNDYFFEKYHMPFIIYNGDDAENIIVEKYVSSLDVLPTILNLFGIEYDSRLLMGKDCFSNEQSLVIFSDRSFITERGKYDSLSDKFILFDNCSIEEGYIDAIKKRIYQQYRYSRLILENDYYKYISLLN